MFRSVFWLLLVLSAYTFGCFHVQAKTITVQAGARVSQVLNALRVSNSTPLHVCLCCEGKIHIACAALRTDPGKFFVYSRATDGRMDTGSSTWNRSVFVNGAFQTCREENSCMHWAKLLYTKCSLVQVDEMITEMTVITPARGRSFVVLSLLSRVYLPVIKSIVIVLIQHSCIGWWECVPLSVDASTYRLYTRLHVPEVRIVRFVLEYLQVGLGSLGIVAEITLKCTESHDLRLRRFVNATCFLLFYVRTFIDGHFSDIWPRGQKCGRSMPTFWSATATCATCGSRTPTKYTWMCRIHLQFHVERTRKFSRQIRFLRGDFFGALFLCSIYILVVKSDLQSGKSGCSNFSRCRESPPRIAFQRSKYKQSWYTKSKYSWFAR